MSSSSAEKVLTRQPSVYAKVSQFLPVGHEKQLKQAIYTTGAMVLFVLIVLVVAYAYFVLQIFIKPLLWAVLCGSFLFPFKYALQAAITTWLKQTWDSEIPLIVSASILPFVIFSKFSDWLGSQVEKKWKIISLFISGLITLYCLNYLNLLTFIINATTSVVNLLFIFVYYLSLFTSNYSGLALLFLGIFLLSSYCLQRPVPPHIYIASWLCLFIYITGIFELPLTFLLLFLFIIGIVNTESIEELQIKSSRDIHGTASCDSKLQNWQNSHSALYFNFLFFVFAVILTWLNIWILLFLLIPLTFWFCKQAFLHPKTSELADVICSKFFGKKKAEIWKDANMLWTTHKSVVFPEPLPYLLTVLKRGDRFMHSLIISYIPTVTSILIIVLLFSNAIIMSVFVVVKVQQETFLMVQISSDLINETVRKHPDYQSWFPDNETMQKSMDSVVDALYFQGREWLSQKIQTSMGPNVNSTKVEKQVLKLWDEIYNASFTQISNKIDKSNISPQNVNEHTGLFHSVLDLLNMSEVLSWLQENVSALMSLVETVLSTFQSNITVIISGLTAILTTLLTGSTMVLNFLVSLVVFFTTLFYLLSSSKNYYKPLEIFGSAFQPLTGTNIESALEQAVNSVFGASIKMFCFYGLYTWVNHCIFGSNLVYIPAILAALFGVVPVLTTYWVCLPSALEIWILQGSLIRAAGLVVCQFLPTLIVDTAIYGDMSKQGGGGHPYVTGLAVAGGFYSFGLEGAVAGPLILCTLLVAVNLYTKETSASSSCAIKTAKETD